MHTWLEQSIGRQVIKKLNKTKQEDRIPSSPTNDNHIPHNMYTAAKSEMMGMTTVFNASGVDKEDFVKYTEANPATYRVRPRQ